MATLKLAKEDSIPLFLFYTNVGTAYAELQKKVSRDVIGVTDTQTEVSVVEICAREKKIHSIILRRYLLRRMAAEKGQKSFYMRFQN